MMGTDTPNNEEPEMATDTTTRTPGAPPMIEDEEGAPTFDLEPGSGDLDDASNSGPVEDEDEDDEPDLEDPGPSSDIAVALPEAIRVAKNAREEQGTQDEGLAKVYAEIGNVPKYMPLSTVQAAAETAGYDDLINVQGRIEQAAMLFGEVRYANQYTAKVLFFTFPRQASGQPLKAKGRVLPVKERQTWTGEGDAPVYEVELSLAAWLLSNEEERTALLHRALMHVEERETPSGTKRLANRPKSVQGWAETIGRFGIADEREAQFVAAAQGHIKTAERLRQYGFEDGGQGCLFDSFTPTTGGGRTL